MRTWKKYRWVGIALGGYLLGAPGCLGLVQQQIEVLGSVGAIGNDLLFRQSFLFDSFGPQLLVFFREFW